MPRLKLPMLKITIVNLSGIHIRRDLNSPLKRDGDSFDNLAPSSSTESVSDHFSITASVTFTGSCSPSDIRVVSSALCSTSGRLLVESRPVVVPVGMTNGLIAAWDDSSTTLTIPRDRPLHYDNILAKTKGSIMAIPQALPHLFVRLDEKRSGSSKKLFSTRELMKIESNLALSTVSSLSEGPDIDDSDLRNLTKDGREEKEDLELRSFLKQNNDASKCCSNTADLTTDQSDQSNNNSQNYHGNLSKLDSFNHENNLTVVNTPSQSDESASIPEILEMQVALHIDQVPHQNDEYQDYDEKMTVKSACHPCTEGGGAVAHLVLFNDFLLNKIENGRDVEDGGIIVLPVRKRSRPPIRAPPYISSHNSNSSLDPNYSPMKQVQNPLDRNNEIWVDLEEDATISVRLERCASEDDPFIEKEEDQIKQGQIDSNVALSNAAANVNSNPQTPSHKQESFQPADFVRNSNFFKDNALARAAFSSKIKCTVGSNLNSDHNGSDRLSDKAQPDITGSYVEDKNRIVTHKGKKGLEARMKMIDHPAGMMCASTVDFEGILKTITNLVSHCGDDVQGYDVHGVMSMDSTIHTNGSI